MIKTPRRLLIIYARILEEFAVCPELHILIIYGNRRGNSIGKLARL